MLFIYLFILRSHCWGITDCRNVSQIPFLPRYDFLLLVMFISFFAMHSYSLTTILPHCNYISLIIPGSFYPSLLSPSSSAFLSRSPSFPIHPASWSISILLSSPYFSMHCHLYFSSESYFLQRLCKSSLVRMRRVSPPFFVGHKGTSPSRSGGGWGMPEISGMLWEIRWKKMGREKRGEWKAGR